MSTPWFNCPVDEKTTTKGPAVDKVFKPNFSMAYQGIRIHSRIQREMYVGTRCNWCLYVSV